MAVSNKLKLAYLVPQLAQGGSERQMVNLAIGMKQRGHEVVVACHHPKAFYDDFLIEKGVQVHRINTNSRMGKILGTRKWLSEYRPDVVHGVMKFASNIAILASIGNGKHKILANDLSGATYSKKKPFLWCSLLLFARADRVLTQTALNASNIAKMAPYLKNRIVVIRNGTDTNLYTPAPREKNECFRFVTVASVWSAKNPVRVMEAIHILRETSAKPFKLIWVGSFYSAGGTPMPEYIEAMKIVEQYGLQDVVEFRGKVSDVVSEYHQSDALLHASVQDGIPNAVCEGMACGLPVVVSRVSDLPLLLEGKGNAILCDQYEPKSIADAMKIMLESSEEERRIQSRISRELAIQLFGMERFYDEFEILYRSMLEER